MVAVVPDSLFSIFSIRSIRLMHAARIIPLICGIPILVRHEIRISRSSGSALQAGGCIIKLHVCFFVGEVDRHIICLGAGYQAVLKVYGRTVYCYGVYVNTLWG